MSRRDLGGKVFGFLFYIYIERGDIFYNIVGDFGDRRRFWISRVESIVRGYSYWFLYFIDYWGN